MNQSARHAVFELNKATFAYPYSEPVIREANLTIQEGEMVAVLGVNGCGKSTLLKIFAGLLCPSQGDFKAFGKMVTPASLEDDSWARDHHSRVGFIFQDSDVQLFCTTVEEEIAFGPLQMGLAEGEVRRRMDDVIKLLGIEHLRGRTPFQLSGGEKKRVAIASVLAMNPQVLILDEPTNGLDPRTQRWLVELLISLNKSGKTLITSTHNLELVQEISKRAVLFDEHHTIVADRPTGELLSDTELLLKVNLVDEYYHRHDSMGHGHFHIHN